MVAALEHHERPVRRGRPRSRSARPRTGRRRGPGATGRRAAACVTAARSRAHRRPQVALGVEGVQRGAVVAALVGAGLRDVARDARAATGSASRSSREHPDPRVDDVDRPGSPAPARGRGRGAAAPAAAPARRPSTARPRPTGRPVASARRRSARSAPAYQSCQPGHVQLAPARAVPGQPRQVHAEAVRRPGARPTAASSTASRRSRAARGPADRRRDRPRTGRPAGRPGRPRAPGRGVRRGPSRHASTCGPRGEHPRVRGVPPPSCGSAPRRSA